MVSLPVCKDLRRTKKDEICNQVRILGNRGLRECNNVIHHLGLIYLRECNNVVHHLGLI